MDIGHVVTGTTFGNEAIFWIEAGYMKTEKGFNNISRSNFRFFFSRAGEGL